jgi:hypothetical protein
MVQDRREPLTDTTAPRTHLGEHSDWYIGTRQETIPTPRPAKIRPATKRGTVVAPVCSATPKEKTRQAVTRLLGEFVWTCRGKAEKGYGPPSTAKDITSWSGQEGAEESASREDGYDKGLVRRGDGVGTTVCGITELLQPGLGKSESRNLPKVGWMRRHTFISLIPEITPVSYPKRILVAWG